MTVPMDPGHTEDLVVVAHPPYTATFEAFVAERGASLLRTAYLLCGDRHHAEDLVQSVLAKAAPRFDALARTGDPTAYVRTMVVRSVIGWRRRRWHGETPTAVLPDRVADGSSTTIDPAGPVVQRDRLRSALAALPPRQRAVVVLRFYEDLSERDAAGVLGCSVGTVKSQTAKGLAALRRVLDDDRGAQ